MGFLLLSFPPIKSFHLASPSSCSSPILPFSFFHFVYTCLCRDNSFLSQRAREGQQCILPSLSCLNCLIIFLLLLSVLFISFFMHHDQHQETVFLVSAVISRNMIRIFWNPTRLSVSSLSWWAVLPAGSMPIVIVSQCSGVCHGPWTFPLYCKVEYFG